MHVKHVVATTIQCVPMLQQSQLTARPESRVAHPCPRRLALSFSAELRLVRDLPGCAFHTEDTENLHQVCCSSPPPPAPWTPCGPAAQPRCHSCPGRLPQLPHRSPRGLPPPQPGLPAGRGCGGADTAGCPPGAGIAMPRAPPTAHARCACLLSAWQAGGRQHSPTRAGADWQDSRTCMAGRLKAACSLSPRNLLYTCS